jgi:dTDP-4-amino-4,6-dideoxygalactose transaminase
LSNIPLVDLRAQWQTIRAEAEPAMAEVLASGGFILGPTVERFERAFASWVGASQAVGVGNGTDAVEIALRACGIGKGDEVLVPVNTFVASAIGVLRAGATPVYVDCDEATFLIDLEKAAAAVTPRTRALLAVHLYGRLCDPAALISFCDAYRLVLVEDAAQAHGARTNGACAGSIGRAAAFSFYPGKNLGAAGDGGAVTTSDPDVAARAQAFRNYGSPRKYEHPEFGVNSRLDALQAALLDVKLRYIDGWNEARRRIARAYSQRLAGVAGVRVPDGCGDDHVMHVFVTRVGGERRDAVLARLGEAGVGAGIHYPVPVAFLPAVDADARRGDFPVAELLAGEILSLPLYPEMSDGQVDRVCETLQAALA